VPASPTRRRPSSTRDAEASAHHLLHRLARPAGLQDRGGVSGGIGVRSNGAERAEPAEGDVGVGLLRDRASRRDRREDRGDGNPGAHVVSLALVVARKDRGPWIAAV
jgi:hypothetical protein